MPKYLQKSVSFIVARIQLFFVFISSRYNRLLVAISSSLNDILKALKGLVVMSQALENLANSLFFNQVPGLWASKVGIYYNTSFYLTFVVYRMSLFLSV